MEREEIPSDDALLDAMLSAWYDDGEDWSSQPACTSKRQYERFVKEQRDDMAPVLAVVRECDPELTALRADVARLTASLEAAQGESARLRDAFDAGREQGESEATAYEWGSIPSQDADSAFADFMAELARPHRGRVMTRPGELLYLAAGWHPEPSNGWDREVRDCLAGKPLPDAAYAINVSVTPPTIRDVTAEFETAVFEAGRPEPAFVSTHIIRNGRAA